MSSNGLRRNPRSAAGIALAALALGLTALGGGQAVAAPQDGAETPSLGTVLQKGDTLAAVSDPFVIKNNNGKCLEITSSSTANGADAQQWTCKGQAGAVWRFKPAGDGFYYFVNEHSKKCLEIEGSSTKNGANAQQWTCNGQAGAKWKWQETRSGDGMTRYLFKNHSGKYLEITNSSTANGANAQQWENKGQSGALWY
ncbi:RICIN domain-containing protein [Kitasatospora sp. NPDC057542]|uniref:RICIN domain-containing protein n=1 Tax=Streptomycetaceae TaxID=2062 RepID=UPI001CCBA370|nr:RICIN domain-containing protein [Streptomyces sp. LS1784]